MKRKYDRYIEHCRLYEESCGSQLGKYGELWNENAVVNSEIKESESPYSVGGETIQIRVIGIHGCGVDYGCTNCYSWFEQYECSFQNFGTVLYQILQKHPFTEYRIEYNLPKSVQHPN